MNAAMESLLVHAERKLGCRKAVFAAVGVSRQRFHSAMNGGPPLHIERLLRLALVAGADPLETLRAGGRAGFADLLEEAARPRLGETTISQRALLREWDRLSDEGRVLIMQLVSGLVAEREGFISRYSLSRAYGQTRAALASDKPGHRHRQELTSSLSARPVLRTRGDTAP